MCERFNKSVLNTSILSPADPVCIQAVQNGRPIVVLKVAAPGGYDLHVPLTRSGDIELSADQWFAPEDYGISCDRRRQSYHALSSPTPRG
jgi:hypothetical protein